MESTLTALLERGASDDDVAALLVRGRCRDITLKRYAGAVRAWLRYCADRGEKPWDAPTAVLMRWLDWRMRESSSPASALRMSLAAARFAQRAFCAIHGHEAVPYTPQARVQLDQFSRASTLQKAEPQHARPLRLDDLLSLVTRIRSDLRRRRGTDATRATLLAARDVAMLLVGWWGALRADDLARLQWDHVHQVVQGLELHIPASKTTAAVLALAQREDEPRLCPRRAVSEYLQVQRSLNAWLCSDEGGIFGFASGGHVGRRIKVLFVRYGVPRGFSGHSLRAGFATEAASQGVPDRLVQNHGRWRSVQVHANYVRSGRLWLDTPTERIKCPLAPIATLSEATVPESGSVSDAASLCQSSENRP